MREPWREQLQPCFDASRVGGGTTFVEGFSMNPSDNWRVGDPKIDRREVEARPLGGCARVARHAAG